MAVNFELDVFTKIRTGFYRVNELVPALKIGLNDQQVAIDRAVHAARSIEMMHLLKRDLQAAFNVDDNQDQLFDNALAMCNSTSYESIAKSYAVLVDLVKSA